MKRYADVNQLMISDLPNHIRSIKTEDRDMRLFVMMVSIINTGLNIYRRKCCS